MLLPLLLLTVPLSIVEHAPVADGVYLNGQGPFRFLIDTGSEGTAVLPAVAARLGLRPEFRTEVVTLAGADWRPGARLRSVAMGALAVEGVDAVFDSLPAVRAVDPSVDGVLGQDVLGRVNYLIDYTRRRLVFDPAARGERVPLRRVEGRPAVEVRAEGRVLRLILDSGVGRVVLFHEADGRGGLRVGTNTGERTGRRRQLARLSVGQSAWADVEAAVVESPEREADGLFPLQMAGVIYVNNREGYVIFPVKWWVANDQAESLTSHPSDGFGCRVRRRIGGGARPAGPRDARKDVGGAGCGRSKEKRGRAGAISRGAGVFVSGRGSAGDAR